MQDGQIEPKYHSMQAELMQFPVTTGVWQLGLEFSYRCKECFAVYILFLFFSEA